MWRRIHSDRDPRDTLFSELQREFGGNLQCLKDLLKRILSQRPKLTLTALTILMLISAGLSFTFFRQNQTAANIPAISLTAPVNSGFDELLQATGRIRETFKLKKLVDSLSAQKHLSSADSLSLLRALDRLQQINQH